MSQTLPSDWSDLARYHPFRMEASSPFQFFSPSSFLSIPHFYHKTKACTSRGISNLHSLWLQLSGDSSYRESYYLADRETWPELSLGKGIHPTFISQPTYRGIKIIHRCFLPACNLLQPIKFFFLMWDWRSLDGDRMYIDRCVYMVVGVILREKWMGVK